MLILDKNVMAKIAKQKAEKALPLLPALEARLDSLKPLAAEIGFCQSGVHWTFAFDNFLLAQGNIARINRGEPHGCPLSCINSANYELDMLEKLAVRIDYHKRNAA